MKPSVEGSAVWRREQGEPVSHLTLTSSDSASAGPRWNAEGREATDDPCSIYTDLVKKHGKWLVHKGTSERATRSPNRSLNECTASENGQCLRRQITHPGTFTLYPHKPSNSLPSRNLVVVCLVLSVQGNESVLHKLRFWPKSLTSWSWYAFWW